MLSDLESDIKEVKCRGKSDKSQEHFYQQLYIYCIASLQASNVKVMFIIC